MYMYFLIETFITFSKNDYLTTGHQLLHLYYSNGSVWVLMKVAKSYISPLTGMQIIAVNYGLMGVYSFYIQH